MGDEPVLEARPETKKRATTVGVAEGNTVAFAKCVHLAKKGEDYAVELLPTEGGPKVSAFAVFDGHSGRTFAKAASESVCQNILKEGPPFTAEKVIEAFWTADAEIGVMPNERAGATAQVLLCEQVDGADGPVIKGTIAWCGDSSLMMTDMSQTGVAFNTVSHTAGPDHQDEDLGTEVKQLMVDLVRVRISELDVAI